MVASYTFALLARIQGKYRRINIAKDVIRVIGMPRYIALRINPEMNSILVESSLEGNRPSFKVPDDLCQNIDRKMSIISTAFVMDVMNSNSLDPSKTYLVNGTYSEKNNAVVFDMKDAQVLI